MSGRFWILDFRFWISSRVVVAIAVSAAIGQIPEPGPARPVSIPAVQEKKLKNGLTVAVI